MSCPKTRTGVPVRGETDRHPCGGDADGGGILGGVPARGVEPAQVGMPPAICASRLFTALQTSRNCLENCVMLFTASVSDLLKFA